MIGSRSGIAAAVLLPILIQTAAISESREAESRAQKIFRLPRPLVEAGRDVRGKVLDHQTSLPVAGATVQTVPPTRTVCTDANGEYRLRGLHGERVYTLVLGKKGYAVNFHSLSPTGQSLRCDMFLYPRANSLSPAFCREKSGEALDPVPAIFGLVIDPATNLAVVGAEVYTVPATERAITDELGTYCLRNRVAYTEYRVFAACAGRTQERPGGYRVQVAGNGWTHCDIPLILER